MTDQQLSPDIFKGWTILAIDDEPDKLFVITRLLEMHGATVVTGKNGEEGFDAAKEHLPVFIISDLSMPKISGYQLLEMLRAEPSTKDIPVIALTAHAMAGDQEKVLKAGFDSYMTKPVIPYSFARDIVKVIYKIPSVFARLAPADAAKKSTQEALSITSEMAKKATQESKPLTSENTQKATQESKAVGTGIANNPNPPAPKPAEEKPVTPPASPESAGSNGSSS